MKHDIAQWTRTCYACQQSKIYRHVEAPLQSFPAPAPQFDSIHVDIVGPLPLSQGYTYLFYCVDTYTVWPVEVIPVMIFDITKYIIRLLVMWFLV